MQDHDGIRSVDSGSQDAPVHDTGSLYECRHYPMNAGGMIKAKDGCAA
jgi:hypothetical protein